MNLGGSLRRRRKAGGMTLKQVAEQAKCSEGFLSQVENNVKSPSVDTLMAICQALGADPGQVLREAQNTNRLHPVLRAEWGDIDVPHTGFATRRFCPPEERSVMDSALIILEPGRSIPVRKDVKNGQEVLCVLEGRLELTRGDQALDMGPGDAAHFFSEPARQSITNQGRARAVALWVGTI